MNLQNQIVSFLLLGAFCVLLFHNSIPHAHKIAEVHHSEVGLTSHEHHHDHHHAHEVPLKKESETPADDNPLIGFFSKYHGSGFFDHHTLAQFSEKERAAKPGPAGSLLLPADHDVISPIGIPIVQANVLPDFYRVRSRAYRITPLRAPPFVG